MLKCENGNYYTGYTKDLIRRYFQHKTGNGGCKYTKSFKPIKIAQCWKVFESQGTAMKIEIYIKRKTKAIKIGFIEKPDSLKSMILDKLKLDLKIFPFDPLVVEAEVLQYENK